jgi:hypothetical protein
MVLTTKNIKLAVFNINLIAKKKKEVLVIVLTK